MKIRNVWFDFTSIVLALFTLGCTAIAVADFFRGKHDNLLAFVLETVPQRCTTPLSAEKHLGLPVIVTIALKK
jgi:hypothetical protein